MDIQELFLGCRKGDLSRVQYLVEQKEVELNVRDKWDSTPLYYACLCGHEDVVKYLLDNGAQCEENTFDGERCLYGALNDTIKKTLKSYKAITSTTIRRDCYQEFLRRAHERGPHSDITFLVNGESFQAHRCILSARSEYFADMLQTKWADKDVVTINHKMVQPDAFKAILKYLYTARLEAHFEQIDDIYRLARYCHLESFVEQIEDRVKKVVTFEMLVCVYKYVDQKGSAAILAIKRSAESTKPGVNVTTISIEPTIETSDLQIDLGILADQAIPAGVCNQADIELPFPPEEIHQYADVIFSVEGHHFHCHKVFFCERSDYFKARVEDNFGESYVTEDDRNLQVVPLGETTSSVFVQILYYIYQDTCLQLTPNNVYDVLCSADMFLLPGLKRHCANVMAQYLDVENCVNILRTARLFTLPRLEDQCAEFIASNIEKMANSEDFASFVKEDAQAVEKREETDSIPIIDDIRFHITNSVQTFSDMYDADEKLSSIDQFLDQLDLDA